MKTPIFTKNLLAWYEKHGRKQLPWQENRNTYRVWISEIMLQQTQVKTVIPYYLRFLETFPDVICLANAPLDDVLEHWAGLGYYTRARNLHSAAKLIRDEYHGHFPTTLDDMMSLPGIGRSTASAILAFSQHQALPILDGNVKRVLTRLHAIAEWPGKRDVEEKLWHLAKQYTPNSRYIADYTQAIMDLGATICTRSNPSCASCPAKNQCLAFAKNETHLYPAKSPKKSLPTKKVFFLVLVNDQHDILFERRPETGIWGGLWSLPESSSEHIPYALQTIIDIHHHIPPDILPDIHHTFSHYKLVATPIRYLIKKTNALAMSENKFLWHNPKSKLLKGVPAPIKKWLKSL